MRRSLAIVLALALGACADHMARQQIIDSRAPDYLERLHAATMAPYYAWEKEDPVSCDSPTLLEARAAVLDTALMITPQKQGFPASYDAARWMLEVADGASARGCSGVARDLYAKVNAIYVGLGYVALRQHASAGLAQLGD
ncbi:MAG TPA: hypothetical protein VMU06_14910 [Stellaceae bacterium]|nr:hypothetical protein [Stellaceae bacterium]